jgi:hypothetical protein
MRQRLLSYFTAACINLSIVSGTHPASLVDRPAIIRVRDGALRRGRFDRRELLANGSVAVETMRATPTTFSPN